jgi:hypothetical protein
MTHAFDHFVMDGPTTPAFLPEVKNGTRRLSMDAHAQKVKSRYTDAQRSLPERNMERVQEGVEAFEQERAELLKARKLRHVVAYEGPKRVALAPNHKKLEKLLLKVKDLKYSDLFITCITPDDDVAIGR